jgi:hypothetical protein
MEHFEETALDTADHNPAKKLRYVDNSFMVWLHGPARLQQFLHHLNSVRPTIKFTTENEANGTLSFLDVLVMKRGPKLATKVYQKPTHAGHYVIHSLISRAKVMCQDHKDFNKEIRNVGHGLMLNEYPQKFVDSIMKPSRSNRPSSDTIYQGTVIIPQVKCISEKFRCIGKQFIVRTIFKTKHTLCGTLLRTGPDRDAQQTKQYVCVCARACVQYPM